MKKILYICGQECILDQRDGGKKCSYRNYSLLKEVYGDDNVFAYIFTNDYHECGEHIHREVAHSTLIMKIFDVMTLHPFYSSKQEEQLLEYIKNNKFDIVFLERSMFGLLIKKLKKAGIRTQVFVHNIEKNYLWNKVKKQSLAFLLPYLSTRWNEKLSFKFVDDIICLTERDSKMVEKIYGRKSNAILPMTFKDSFVQERMDKIDLSERKRLLFIGSLFPPNYDGIKWFVDNVMCVLEDYLLLIVGKKFEKKENELSRQNVRVIGTVDDLEQYYYSNSAMVMPILYGDGMKIKTAEAIMYGKVIFASNEALEGYDVEEVEGIYRCNTVDQYVKSINSVFDSRQNVGFSLSVRKKFVDTYDNLVATSIYRSTFREYLEG